MSEKQYIGTKMIKATPKTFIDPKTSAHREGYAVTYSDGYQSWSPKAVFEEHYAEMTNSDGTRITQQMVDDFISSYSTQTQGKTTIVHAVLRNGFEIIESSSCVSLDNYDEKLGEEICLKRVKDKVWYLLGFTLQWALQSLVPVGEVTAPVGRASCNAQDASFGE